MITKPMLAASYKGELPAFPLLATPKIDGVRALIVNGCLISRSFKPIPNANVRRILESVLPEGADGEITCGSLYDTTSVVMSENTSFDCLTFSWFDWAYDINAPYADRINAIATYMQEHTMPKHINIVPLIPVLVENIHELENFNTSALNQGYEGVVVRIPNGRYKCGRSTIKEGLMIKIKQYADYEAEIVGVEELMHNTNEEQLDNFGNVRRGSSQSGLVRGNTLGAIIAVTPNYDVFKIGTGFTSDERDALWANRDMIIGQLVKYKCDFTSKQGETGSKNLPRSPVFLGIRHKDDIN